MTDLTRALLIWLVLLGATAIIGTLVLTVAWRTRNRHQHPALTDAQWDRLLADERSDR